MHGYCFKAVDFDVHCNTPLCSYFCIYIHYFLEDQLFSLFFWYMYVHVYLLFCIFTLCLYFTPNSIAGQYADKNIICNLCKASSCVTVNKRKRFVSCSNGISREITPFWKHFKHIDCFPWRKSPCRVDFFYIQWSSSIIMNQVCYVMDALV